METQSLGKRRKAGSCETNRFETTIFARSDCRPVVIKAEKLTRTFQTYRKEPGFGGAVRGLFHRKMDETVAAKELTFEIGAGEVVGLLGPNGAGKTTTLKMLAGILHPTSGRATVLGHVPWERHRAFQQQISLLLGQKNQLWWDLPARESLQLNGRIYGIPRADFEKTLLEFTEMLDVRDKLNVMVRELSLGERMKMELVAALLHRPKVLFLDEPTIGLDVVSQTAVREFLGRYNKEFEVTIILTSHYMADVEALCPRVLLIDDGRVRFDGPLEKITERFANHKFIEINSRTGADLSQFMHLLPDAEVVQTDNVRCRLKVPRDRVAAVCRFLLERLEIKDLSVEGASMEEVFRSVYRAQRFS